MRVTVSSLAVPSVCDEAGTHKDGVSGCGDMCPQRQAICFLFSMSWNLVPLLPELQKAAGIQHLTKTAMGSRPV